jgi:hypothetical protein
MLKWPNEDKAIRTSNVFAFRLYLAIWQFDHVAISATIDPHPRRDVNSRGGVLGRGCGGVGVWASEPVLRSPKTSENARSDRISPPKRRIIPTARQILPRICKILRATWKIPGTNPHPVRTNSHLVPTTLLFVRANSHPVPTMLHFVSTISHIITTMVHFPPPEPHPDRPLTFGLVLLAGTQYATRRPPRTQPPHPTGNPPPCCRTLSPRPLAPVASGRPGAPRRIHDSGHLPWLPLLCSSWGWWPVPSP